MPVAALIPIRSFASGKGRLGAVLTEKQRYELGTTMAEHTVTAAEAALMIPAIVTGDHDVSTWAMVRGLIVVEESEPGLDAAAAGGSRWAMSSGLRWAVLHSDLPLVRPDDLAVLVDLIEEGRDVIAPSSDGGTTAISSSDEVAFAYGPGSFHHHLARLRDAQVVSRIGLLHDLDSAADLGSASTHPLGTWVRSIVQGVAP